MENINGNKPIYKKWWFWAAIVIIIVIITPNDDAEKETPQQADAPAVAETEPEELPESVDDVADVTETDAEEPVNEPVVKWPDANVTVDSVKNALKDAKGARTIKLTDSTLKEIAINDHMGTDAPTDKIVHVHVNPGTVWDETDYARRLAESIVTYSEVMFKHPDVAEVIIWGYTQFTDEYGNEKENVAIRIGWSRATSEKVNYDNFKSMVTGDYTRSYNLADSYMIHPGIFQRLKDRGNLSANK
jgi:hypothetical protein